MKVAFVLAPRTTISGKSNGVRNRCINWASALMKAGTDVTMISPFDGHRIGEFDVVHCFHRGFWYYEFIRAAGNSGRPPILISPIEDSNPPALRTRFKRFMNFRKRRFQAFKNNLISESFNASDGIVVRSEYEAGQLADKYGVAKKKMKVIPIGVDLLDKEYVSSDAKKKQVFHISSIYQQRKNVPRLIKACVQQDIHLVLAGYGGPDFQNTEVFRLIEKYGEERISYHGFVTQEELHALFRESRIFALPSLMEGVGNVALEAAAFGCEIVLTERGGPKEYYDGLAHLVDPKSVKDIGKGIRSAMESPKQPDLRKHIERDHSIEATVRELNVYYASLVGEESSIFKNHS